MCACLSVCLPAPTCGALRAEWVEVADGSWSFVTVASVPRASETDLLAPHLRPDDGCAPPPRPARSPLHACANPPARRRCMDVLLIRHDVPRWRLLRLFLQMGSGQHMFNRDCAFYRVRAVHVLPRCVRACSMLMHAGVELTVAAPAQRGARTRARLARRRAPARARVAHDATPAWRHAHVR
jgi:hypothetical protein